MKFIVEKNVSMLIQEGRIHKIKALKAARDYSLLDMYVSLYTKHYFSVYDNLTNIRSLLRKKK